MLLNFLSVFLMFGLLLTYVTECQLYLFSAINLGFRVDSYTISFYLLLGVVSGCVGV